MSTPTRNPKKPLTETEVLETKDDADLREENRLLREEVRRLQEQVQALAQEKSPQSSGRGGWVIKTPNPKYNGSTAGINFRGGTAFIPDGMAGARDTVRMLQADFKYTAEHVDDFQALPAAETLNRTFVDILTGAPPQ